MKLSELNPREKFYVDNKGGIFQKQAATTSEITGNGGFICKCLCCDSYLFINNDTEVFTLEYGSPVERKLFEEGYAAAERLIMKAIENWEGKDNSAIGDALLNKFAEIFDKIGITKSSYEQFMSNLEKERETNPSMTMSQSYRNLIKSKLK